MIKVKATSASRDNSIEIKDLGKIVDEGTIFEIPDERLDILLGKNDYKLKFVEVVGEVKTETLEDKVEVKKAVRKTARSK